MCMGYGRYGSRKLGSDLGHFPKRQKRSFWALWGFPFVAAVFFPFVAAVVAAVFFAFVAAVLYPASKAFSTADVACRADSSGESVQCNDEQTGVAYDLCGRPRFAQDSCATPNAMRPQCCLAGHMISQRAARAFQELLHPFSAERCRHDGPQ